MSAYTYKATLGALSSNECIKEASADELRILLAIIEHGDDLPDAARLSAVTGISQARTKAAIALFEASGIIKKVDTSAGISLEYEFEDKDRDDDKFIPGAKETAHAIRDNDLAELFLELEKLFARSLDPTNAGRIVLLLNQLGVTPHYIMMLASHVTETRKNPSFATLERIARELHGEGITALEDLEIYIAKKSRYKSETAELRSIFGIYSRALSSGEDTAFSKWLNEYGYSTGIIGEAYDICVASTGKYSYKYIDKVLTVWHNAGINTLTDCRTYTDTHRDEFFSEKIEKKKTKKVKEAEVPKYADFNSEDALMKALERSYSDTDNS